MHTISLGLFFEHIQPAYQRDSFKGEDARRLLRVFRSLVDEEDLGEEPSLSIKLWTPKAPWWSVLWIDNLEPPSTLWEVWGF
jgi:hypothetical protein